MLSSLKNVKIGPLVTTAIAFAVVGVAMLSPVAVREGTSAGHAFVPTTVEIAGSDPEPAPTY